MPKTKAWVVFLIVTPPGPCRFTDCKMNFLILFSIKIYLIHKGWSIRFIEAVSDVRSKEVTFFPRITAPGSPWITMYFAPPRNSPVGARNPGSSKSFWIPAISSAFNYRTYQEHTAICIRLNKEKSVNTLDYWCTSLNTTIPQLTQLLKQWS